MNTNKQLEGILSGSLDVGFFFDRSLSDASFEADVVMVDKVCVAASPQSKVSDRQDVLLADLASDDFIWFPRQKDPWFYDELMSVCRFANLAPRIAHEAVNDSSMLSLVSAGLGLAFVPMSSCVRAGNCVSVLQPRDLNIELRLELVSRKGNKRAAVSAFRDIVAQVINDRAC